MKRSTAYILAAVAILLAAAYLVFSLAITSRQREGAVCTAVKVSVKDSSRHSFITSKDILDCIRREYGECVGRNVSEIDLDGIEKVLKNENPVLGAEAFVSSNGVLNVKVVQREPVLRFKNSSVDFFTDSDGYIFHLKSGVGPEVAVVGGSIPVKVGADFRGELQDSASGVWIRKMIALSKYIGRTALWDGVSMNVRNNGDIEIRPSGGPLFIFGPPEDFPVKFARIGRYYSAIVPEVGADFYSTVNVKFAGQVVCRK